MSEFLPGEIPGVVHVQLQPIADTRGSFTELWRASLTIPLAPPFVQANLSRSRSNVLRGMHFHERQSDLWVALQGHATVSLVDLRPVIAETSDRPVVEQFTLAVGGAVLIPSRVAHGFLAGEAFELLYLVTVEYDGTDEFGFAWNDPVVGLEWPADRPILSSRDSTIGSLREAVAAARQRESLAPAM